MTKLYIGTSGWSYPHWKNCFYAGVPKKNWLRYYAEKFTSVEVNATFYRLQNSNTFKRWYSETPDSFTFAVKANRFLTHNKKLKAPIQSIQIEKEHASYLKNKLAVVLWQLPNSLKKDLPRLKSFLNALALWNEVRHTLEFRHPSWFDDETSDCLADYRVAVCISDSSDWPLWEHVTTDLVYIRLHGKTVAYSSPYSSTELAHWAERISCWLSEKRKVHIYFDNDTNCHATRNAMELKSMLHDQDFIL